MALTLPGIWATIDGCNDAELFDTPDEARAFSEEVRQSALVKFGEGGVTGAGSEENQVSSRARRSSPGVVDIVQESRHIALPDGKGEPEGQSKVQSTSPSRTNTSRRVLPTFPLQYSDITLDQSLLPLPSFHPSHIQHCSTPIEPVHPPQPTRSSVSPRKGPTNQNPVLPSAEAGPGPQTEASRARSKFSKVVSAPALPRPVSGSSPKPTRTRKRAVDDSTPIRPSHPRLRLVASTSPSQLLSSRQSLNNDQADVSVAPTMDEAPSRTHIMTTPIATKSTRSSNSRIGKMTIDIPVGDITDAPLVASPTDTPGADGPRSGNNTANESEVAITPLGNAKLRGKSYLALSKHFDAFTRALNKPEKPAKGPGRAVLGKGASAGPGIAAIRKVSSDQAVAANGSHTAVGLQRTGTMLPGQGMDGVLAGCRFCIPPDHAGLSKHKQRWDIITKLGGHVSLIPDTATSHIIYEGRAPAALARELGLTSLDDLPDGCVCVKWEWVANCKLQSRKIDTGPYLSFGRKASGGILATAGPSRTSSRFMDITDQLKGKIGADATRAASTTSIRKRRGATASDSETEESRPLEGKRIRSSPIQLQRQPTRPRTTSSPAKIGTPGSPGSAALTEVLPAQNGNKGKGKTPVVSTVDTDHGPATKPQWNDGGTQDGLDIMISGVQSGKVDAREEGDDDDSPNGDPDPGADSAEPGNPCPMADRFKCGQAHNGSPLSPDEHPNEWLAKEFDKMHDMYTGAQHKNEWQVRGYRNAAAAMRRTKEPVFSSAQASKIKGIGQSMADRIDEFISGRRGRQYYDMDEQMHAVSAFAKIYGVGKTQANALYNRGARTIADLSAPGNPYNLTSGQLTGVALYDDLNTRIPRAECKEIFDIVRKQATRADPKVWIEIMGSYRRGSENSGDVDILITRDTEDGRTHVGVMRKLIKGLVADGIITHELSLPHDWDELEAKWMGVCKLPGGLHRRIDILCIPFEQWGAALLYFTGNDIFNRSLRLYARKMGYSLNQRGLSKGVIRGKDGLKFTEGEIVASRTEQEIFDRLGLRWRPPHQRRP